MFFTKKLVIEHILSDHIVINSGLGAVYGCRVESHSEVYTHIHPRRVASLIQAGRTAAMNYNNLFFVVVHRYRVKSKKLNNPYRTDVYYFSYNKKLLKQLTEGLNVKFLDGLRLADALLHIHALAPMWKRIDIVRKLPVVNRRVPMEEFYNPVPSETYHSLFMNLAFSRDPEREIEKLRVYGNNIFLSPDVKALEESMMEFYRGKVQWEGALWLVFNFNNATPILEAKAASQRMVAGSRYSEWKRIADEYKAGSLDIAPVAIYLISNKGDEIDEVADVIFEKFGFQCVRKRMLELNMFLATPLKVVDQSDLYFLSVDDLACYIPVQYQKTVINPDKIRRVNDLVGRTPYGDVVFYSLWGDNPAQHSLIVAPTGSGKTFFLLNMMSEMLNIDVAKLYDGTLKGRSLEFKVRFLDVGLSGEFFANLLKERGFNIDVVQPDPAKIRYNVCEAEAETPEDLERELKFALGIIGLILEVKAQKAGDSSGALSVAEESILMRALRRLHANKAKYIKLPSARQLKSEFPELYQMLIESGRLSEGAMSISYEQVAGTPIGQPRVSDLIAYLNYEKKSPDVPSEMREHYESLIAKLQYIAELPNFSGYSSVSIANSEFLYIDLVMLKQIGEEIFEPLVMAILKKLVYLDSAFGDEKPKLYIIEEAHNLLKRQAFGKMFDTLTREARKHRIYLSYVSQNLQDIPPAIKGNIHTKFVLSPSRREEVDSIADALELNDRERGILHDLPRYHLMVSYSDGLFTMTLPVDEAKLKVFDSNAVELVTPDGLVLRKGKGVMRMKERAKEVAHAV